MRCEQVQPLISAHIDNELPAADRRAVAAHMATCAACAATEAEMRDTGRALAALGRTPLPPDLGARIAAEIAHADAVDNIAVPVPARVWRVPVHWLRQAALLVFACGLTALATLWIAGAADRTARVEQDIFAAHVRSLLQDSSIQIASSDAHTVKPWLVGRVDFAPEVKDLAAEGFPLIGGRLDFIDGKRVAAMVYRRRLHLIDVFVWLTPSAGSTAPMLVARNGYNLVIWTRNGVTHAAISDLSAQELLQLQQLL